MAVLQLSPSSEAFERARALSDIARTVLATRIVCCLLVLVWLAMQPRLAGTATCLALASVWLVLLLRHWSSFGVLVSTHPVILALDTLGCFVLLAASGPISPAVLILGTGCLLIGLCLARRGAMWFTPLILTGWWVVYALGTSGHRVEVSSQAFVALVLVPALLIGSLFVGAAVRLATLDAAAAEQLLRTQIRVAGVAEERARLAREMHDSLVKSLHGIAMMADALPRWVVANPDRAKAQAATIATLLKKTSHESRELVLAMRRAPANATVPEIIRGTAERWERSSGRRVLLQVTGEPSLPTESAYELSAILNEALENVGRHTPPQASATVTLAEQHAWVVLVVRDDGGGASAPEGLTRSGHFGLLGMKERASRVGGEVTVESRPGVGVVVNARLPGLNDLDDLDDLDEPEEGQVSR